MRAVAKHSVELATCVTETGAVDVLVVLLEDFDVSVREAAAAALAGICSHGAGLLRRLLPFRAASTPCCDGIFYAWLTWSLARRAELGNTVVDSGAVALLVVCLQEPDVALKRACALALAEIANFSVEVGASLRCSALEALLRNGPAAP